MSHEKPKPSFWVILLRHVIPAVVCLGGIVLFAVERDQNAADGSAMIIGAGLSWWLMGWLFRKGWEGESERDAEEAARDYFTEHGEWPTDEQTERFVRTGTWERAADAPEPAARAGS